MACSARSLLLPSIPGIGTPAKFSRRGVRKRKSCTTVELSLYQLMIFESHDFGGGDISKVLRNVPGETIRRGCQMKVKAADLSL